MSHPEQVLSSRSSEHIVSTREGLAQPKPLEGNQNPHLHDAPESLAAPLVQIAQYINSNQRSMVQYKYQVTSSIRVRQNVDPRYLEKRLKPVNLLVEESVPEYVRDFA